MIQRKSMIPMYLMIEEWTLIIQSSVVLFLRDWSPFVERFYIYIFNTAWNREMLAHLKNIPSDRQCSPADDPHGNEGRWRGLKVSASLHPKSPERLSLSALQQILLSFWKSYVHIQIICSNQSSGFVNWDVQCHMGREHASREKKLTTVNFLIFVHKNIYRIRFQKIKIGSWKGFEKKAFFSLLLMRKRLSPIIGPFPHSQLGHFQCPKRSLFLKTL